MITKIDDITYLLDSDKKCATVTKSLSPYSGAVVIPSSIVVDAVEYSVVDILDEAFMDCTGLRSECLAIISILSV